MIKPNIKDVAKTAGVSIATVSNVINRKGRVSDKMTRHIEGIIEELGYSPNITARGLKQQQSYLIAMVVPFETLDGNLQDNPFYWNLASGIESGARDSKFHVILSGVQQDDPHSLDFAGQRHLDGLVVVGAARESKLMEQIDALNIHAVFIDSDIQRQDTFEVTIDDYTGIKKAAEYLIDQGHTKIATVSGEVEGSGVMQTRHQGFKEALIQKNLNYVPGRHIETPVSIEGGITGGKLLLEIQDITAVLCYSDVQAFGVIKHLTDRGIAIPTELSVMGFDDLYFSKFLSPPLTTVAQDIIEKGKKAAELLIQQIRKENPAEHKIILPTTLIERDSVRINKRD